MDAPIRKDLIRFREQILKFLFPHHPARSGLLRKGMLDLIVKHRPITVEEFISMGPVRLLRETSREQIGFVAPVLNIVRKHTMQNPVLLGCLEAAVAAVVTCSLIDLGQDPVRLGRWAGDGE